jgi:two-component system KDP operon response regulator KdpE
MPPLVRILIVDDEKTIRKVLSEALQGHNFIVSSVGCSEEALCALEQGNFDLVLLDLKLPGTLDGLDLLREIHSRWRHIVIIMLTAYATIDSAVLALREGAYDYLTKPASIPQILESIESGLAKQHEETRRVQLISRLEQTLEELKADEQNSQIESNVAERFTKTSTLLIDRKKRLAVRGTQPITLSATEFDVLDYLIQHSDRVVNASQVLRAVQGYEVTETDARPILRVHIQRLRQKLEDDADNPKYILNVRGRGYRFVG